MLNNVNGFEKEKELLKDIKNVKRESKVLDKLSKREFDLFIDYLKLVVIKEESNSKMKMINKTLSKYDSTESLANTDVQIVNDALLEIRKKKTAYLYYIRYIMLLLKYEPLVDVQYHDGIYYCSLPKKILVIHS